MGSIKLYCKIKGKSVKSKKNGKSKNIRTLNGNDLIDLYKNFGLSELKKRNIDSGCFYLTHAYILALEKGLRVAKRIHQILKLYGREE